MAVIGGGAIGCEFASMFADLGVSVTILEALPNLLPGCDEDVVRQLSRSFNKRGIAVYTGVQVRGHSPRGAGTTVSYGEDQTLDVEMVVVSVGRRPYTEQLVEGDTGVVIDDRGFVVVDEFQRTGEPGVWAVGDVVNSPQLAHVGFAEGIVAVKNMLSEPVVPVDYTRVPWCIYCHPEVAFAGLSEAAARQAGYDVVVKKDPFGGNSRARILGETEGLVKIIAERGSRRKGRADPRSAHGRTVGHRATRPGISGGQLGSDSRRGGAIPAAPSDAVRRVRRDRPGSDRKGTARWLT